MLSRVLRKIGQIICIVVIGLSFVLFGYSKDVDYSQVKEMGLSKEDIDEILGATLEFQITALHKEVDPRPTRYLVKVLDGYPDKKYLENYNPSDASVWGGYMKHLDKRCKTAAIYLEELNREEDTVVEVIGTVICSRSYKDVRYGVVLRGGSWKVEYSTFKLNSLESVSNT